MPRPPKDLSEWGLGYETQTRAQQLAKHGPERIIYVGGGSALCPPWQNFFDHQGPPYAAVGFYFDLHGKLKFVGHIDASAASSGTVAFTLPDIFVPDHDDSWVTDVWDGTTFSLARVWIDSASGDVTITWPAS
jgi:hypothetical protein